MSKQQYEADSNNLDDNESGSIVVIKVGTSSLVDPIANQLLVSNIARICELVKSLKSKGHNVVLVSSGAVGVGCKQLKMKKSPGKISEKQALAAVGQLHLMRHYDDFFNSLNMTCAQVLLTHDMFECRYQYLNTRETLAQLIKFNVTPIVNENDTVAVEQLRIGDNDTLSARVAIMCEASWLFMLTDVPYLYTSNPRIDPNAAPIFEVHDIEQLEVDVSSKGTQWGTGGMSTKLKAARLVTAAGCHAAICKSKDPEVILDILSGQKKGTKFFWTKKEKGKKRWLLSLKVKGRLHLDDGAVDAVLNKHKSLFSVGIRKVVGDFSSDECVSICNSSGNEFARGLVNYDSIDIEKVLGKKSSYFMKHLDGYSAEEMIHIHNMCMLKSPESTNSDSSDEQS